MHREKRGWLLAFSAALATFAVCGMGCYCMHLSGGKTGIGWSILGVFLIWASASDGWSIKIKDED